MYYANSPRPRPATTHRSVAQPSSAQGLTGGAERQHWADIAKAAAVVLVVVYHVAPTFANSMTLNSNAFEDAVTHFSRALLPLRIPLFFFVSGILARNAIMRPWRGAAQKRIVDLLWVYWLWTLVYVVPYSADRGELSGEVVHRSSLWVFNFASTYWYLPALVAFFVLARATRRVPWSIVVGLALAARLVADMTYSGDSIFVADLEMTLYRWSMYFIWFAIGARAVELVDQTRSLARFTWPVVLAGFGFLAHYRMVGEVPFDLSLIVTMLGLVGSIGLCEALARFEICCRVGRYLAGRTLPIYIFHGLFLAIIRAVSDPFPELSSMQSAIFLGLLTFGLVGASCLIWDALEKPCWYLFRAPSVVGDAPMSPRHERRRSAATSAAALLDMLPRRRRRAARH